MSPSQTQPQTKLSPESQEILTSLQQNLGTFTTLTHIKHASKFEATLSYTEHDRYKIQALECFMNSIHISQTRFDAEILIYRATGQFSGFFLPEQQMGSLTAWEVKELSHCVVGVVRLVVEDRVGGFDGELVAFRNDGKSPAQCLKRYMARYRNEQRFVLWDQSRITELRSKIFATLHADTVKGFVDFSKPCLAYIDASTSVMESCEEGEEAEEDYESLANDMRSSAQEAGISPYARRYREKKTTYYQMKADIQLARRQLDTAVEISNQSQKSPDKLLGHVTPDQKEHIKTILLESDGAEGMNEKLQKIKGLTSEALHLVNVMFEPHIAVREAQKRLREVEAVYGAWKGCLNPVEAEREK